MRTEHTPRRLRHLAILLCATLVASTLTVVATAGPASAKDESDQPVILIHGFSWNASHNCNDYFGDLRDYLKKEGRTVVIVGYYVGSRGCERIIEGSQSTSLHTVGEALRDYILETFGDQPVDIVAHSLGGIVVRAMLDRDGSKLDVDDVVTLGTPHGGTTGLTTSALCPLAGQCLEVWPGSSFLAGLEHNPQGRHGTEWTLIGTYNDEVVGPHTSNAMARDGDDKPEVDRYKYGKNVRIAENCPAMTHLLGHGQLHSNVIARDCTWTYSGDVFAAIVEPPFEKVRAAIDD